MRRVCRRSPYAVVLTLCVAVVSAACPAGPGASNHTPTPGEPGHVVQADGRGVLNTPPSPASDAPAPAVIQPTATVAPAPSHVALSGVQNDAQVAEDVSTDGDVVAADTPLADVRVPANETRVGLATLTPTRTATPAHTPSPTATPQSGGVPNIGGCNVFPSNNPWNADISGYAVHPNSQNFINNILAGSGTDKVHPDFGSNAAYGIPFIVVPQSEPMVPINFTDYGDESDPGPYPIPLNAPNEGGGDRHVIAVQQGTCMLYELFNAWPQANRWDASSGAIWNLSSNALRPAGWTSADAAGLPILPGLVRYDEVQSGAIRHALRFTVQSSQRAYILPATHFASSSTDPNRPPMGLRLRLKSSFDISGYHGDARVILEALRKYGMILADNGSNWYISGARDPRWDDDDLNQLKTIPGSAFEAVYTGETITP